MTLMATYQALYGGNAEWAEDFDHAGGAGIAV